MRNAFLFPLSLSVLVAAGCGSQVKERAARSDLKRDLTLVRQTGQTAIATPIELGQIRAPAAGRSAVSSHHRVRHRPTPRSTVTTPKPVEVAAEAAPAPAAVQRTVMAPADPHELPPGATVSIIPVSSGPSTSDGAGRDRFPPPGYGTGGSGMGGGGSGMGGGERAGGGSGMGGDCPRPEFGPSGGTRGLMY